MPSGSNERIFRCSTKQESKLLARCWRSYAKFEKKQPRRDVQIESLELVKEFSENMEELIVIELSMEQTIKPFKECREDIFEYE